MKKIVIFASGSGSNAENIMRHFAENKSGIVVAVFTNNSDAKVIQKAENRGVLTEIFTKNDLIESNVLQKLKRIQPDLIVLAGFLLKFPQDILTAFPDKVINIHPALLPKYGGKGMYGMYIHKAVVANNEKETGITIHYVNENYDEGNIIFQKSVPITSLDIAEDVAAKIHTLEQECFPNVIEQFLNNEK